MDSKSEEDISKRIDKFPKSWGDKRGDGEEREIREKMKNGMSKCDYENENLEIISCRTTIRKNFPFFIFAWECQNHPLYIGIVKLQGEGRDERKEREEKEVERKARMEWRDQKKDYIEEEERKWELGDGVQAEREREEKFGGRPWIILMRYER